jgi:hypothetical protein
MFIFFSVVLVFVWFYFYKTRFISTLSQMPLNYNHEQMPLLLQTTVHQRMGGIIQSSSFQL